MNKEAVAVTGIGIISPLGLDKASTWSALLKGQSGVSTIQQFDASHFPTKIAAEVKHFDPLARVPKKVQKYTVPFTNYAFAAAEEALTDAGIRPEASTAYDWGVVVGAGMMTAEFPYLDKFQKRFAKDGQIDWHQVGQAYRDFFEAQEFGRTIANSGLSLLMHHYQIKGYSTSVHTACASGGQALGLGMQAIRRGDADTILAGGFDSMINPLGLSSFCLLGALSTYNESPQTASRPFDATRNGFVLGEGACFLVLEKLNKAEKRGAHIYALLAGEGNSLSSYRITDAHPSGDGAKQAIEQALVDASVMPTEVDYINAHGTSTLMNDKSETNAIKAVFKDNAYQIPVSSTKSLTGHLIAAAGCLEGAFAALSIADGKIPMTANLTKKDNECDLDYVTEGAREGNVNVAMTNSFGFGGSNSALVFKAYQGGA